MSQFFIDSKNISGDLIKIIDKNEIRHIVYARRFKEGDKIDLFDDKKNRYKGVIDRITDDAVIINIVETAPPNCGGASLQAPELTIACALPKNAKFDYIVEKLTELGVCRIIPMITERTIVRLQPDKARERVERFRKITKEAAKQSSNPNIPIIDEITDFKDIFCRGACLPARQALLCAHFDLILIPTLVETAPPNCGGASLREIVETHCNASLHKILVLIGPEGDFTPQEVEFAINNGAKPVSFGERILKVDTACIFIASVLSLHENI